MKYIKKLFLNEKLFTTLLVFLAIIGLSFHIYKFYQDRLEANLETKQTVITKINPDSFYTEKAINYLSEVKISVEGYQQTVTPSEDGHAYTFLERTLGKKDTFSYFSKNNYELLSYEVRFYKEYETREVFVTLDAVTGRVIGFFEAIPEKEDRVNISKEQALMLIEKYLPLDKKLELKDYQTNTAQKRIDHNLTFKDNSTVVPTKYGETYIEYSYTVLGDKFGGFSKYVFVPEDFGREINKTLSIGSLMSTVSFLAEILILGLSLIFCIKAFIRGQVRWRLFAIISGSIILFEFLSNIDAFKGLLSGYSTDQGFIIYILGVIFSGLLYSFSGPAGVFTSLAAGKKLDDDTHGGQLAGSSKDLGKNVLRGYLIAGISLGLSTLLYFLGEKYLGVWSPGLDNPYNVTWSLLPILGALALGFSSAISEEVIYRYFGFLVTKKFIKKTVLAALITTVIWAFAHSNYPVFPVYFRGIELMIGGTLWMYFVLRYNIITTIVAHYIFNVFLFSLPFILTNNLFYILNGLVALTIPFIIYLLYKRFYLKKD